VLFYAELAILVRINAKFTILSQKVKKISREGAQPLLRKFFLTFWLKIVHFGVYSDKNSQFSIE